MATIKTHDLTSSIKTLIELYSIPDVLYAVAFTCRNKDEKDIAHVLDGIAHIIEKKKIMVIS